MQVDNETDEALDLDGSVAHGVGAFSPPSLQPVLGTWENEVRAEAVAKQGKQHRHYDNSSNIKISCEDSCHQETCLVVGLDVLSPVCEVSEELVRRGHPEG
jgi:hypothetical protein